MLTMLPTLTDISASNTCDGAITENSVLLPMNFIKRTGRLMLLITEITANFDAIFWLPLCTTEIALP